MSCEKCDIQNNIKKYFILYSKQLEEPKKAVAVNDNRLSFFQ